MGISSYDNVAEFIAEISVGMNGDIVMTECDVDEISADVMENGSEAVDHMVTSLGEEPSVGHHMITGTYCWNNRDETDWSDHEYFNVEATPHE